jgi:hypothetical protein
MSGPPKTIRDLPPKTAPDPTDIVLLVDPNNHTQSPDGTDMQMSVEDFLKSINDALGPLVQGQTDDLATRIGLLESLVASNANNVNAALLATDDSEAISMMECYYAFTSATQPIDDTAHGPGVNVTGTKKAVVFDSVRDEHPAGAHFDLANAATGQVWTCPEDGLYFISTSVAFSQAAGGRREVEVTYTRGVDEHSAGQDSRLPINDGNPDKFTLSFVKLFLKDDVVKVKMYHNTGLSVNIVKAAAPAEYSPTFRVAKIGHWKRSHIDLDAPGGSPPDPGTAPFTPLYDYAAIDPYPDWVGNETIASLGVGVRSNSAAIVAGIFGRGNGNIGVNEKPGGGGGANDFSHPLYVCDGSEPTYTLVQSVWPNPDVEGMTVYLPQAYTDPVSGQPRMLGSGGTDFSLGVLQPDGVTEIDLWGITSIGGGQIVCGFARKGDITTDGQFHLIGGHERGGITAARFQHMVGIARADEIISGTIPHALFCAINGWRGVPGVQGYGVYPAPAILGKTGVIADSNAPEMGTLLRVKASFNTSGLPAWQQTFFNCLKTYGFYIGDNGGSTLNFHFESDTPYYALNVSPTVQDHLAAVLGHSGKWDISTGITWPSIVEVMDPPSP